MKYLIIALALFPVAVSAQSITGYSNGFVVKNNNDTLYGLVKIRNAFPYQIYNDVHFKNDADSKPALFLPEDITGFSIGNEVYESKSVLSVRTTETKTKYIQPFQH